MQLCWCELQLRQSHAGAAASVELQAYGVTVVAVIAIANQCAAASQAVVDRRPALCTRQGDNQAGGGDCRFGGECEQHDANELCEPAHHSPLFNEESHELELQRAADC